jgi:hypothetical protein
LPLRHNMKPHRLEIKLVYSCMMLLAFNFSFAQSQPDTVPSPLYKSYMASIGAGANLYNGTEYTAVYPLTKGSPFWNDTGFETGIISYNGVVYKDIPIAYDLVSNEVIIKNYQQLTIKLDAARVDFFLVSNRLFVRAKAEEASKNMLPEDFYELLYNGKVKVFVKRKKQVERSFNVEDPYRFTLYSAYFIYKDSMYHQVTSRNSLLNLLRDKRDAITDYWKQHNLNYRTDAEKTIVETVTYYTKLKE